MKKIVALHGLPGSGKDTIADLLVEEEGYTKVAFAAGLYEEVAGIFSTTAEALRSRYAKTVPMNELALFNCIDPGYRRFMHEEKYDLYTPRTSRFHLTHYGTDYMATLDPLRWVKIAMKSISDCDGSVVVSDLRTYRDFREWKALHSLAIDTKAYLKVVHLRRASSVGSAHESDTPLPDYMVDEFVDAVEGDIPATYDAVKKALGWF